MLTISEQSDRMGKRHISFYRKISKDKLEIFSNYIAMFIKDPYLK